jgi:hypothetical protein
MIIGCKLPNGIVLEVGEKSVEINGLNKSVIIGATHATTEVDNDFWQAWKKEHADFPALKSGAIFEAKTEKDAAVAVKDTGKTGLEPMPQDNKLDDK